MRFVHVRFDGSRKSYTYEHEGPEELTPGDRVEVATPRGLVAATIASGVFDTRSEALPHLSADELNNLDLRPIQRVLSCAAAQVANHNDLPKHQGPKP